MAINDDARTFPPQSSSASSLIAFVVPVLIVGVAAVLLSRRKSGDVGQRVGAVTAKSGSRRGGNARRRLLLTVAINALENDMLRRGVIAAMKLARSRS